MDWTVGNPHRNYDSNPHSDHLYAVDDSLYDLNHTPKDSPQAPLPNYILLVHQYSAIEQYTALRFQSHFTLSDVAQTPQRSLDAADYCMTPDTQFDTHLE